MRLLKRTGLSFGMVCWVGCVGARSGLDDGVHIVVPSDGGPGEVTILDGQGRPVRVRVWNGPVTLRCRASQMVVEGVWGVVWEVDEKDRSRMEAAMKECGEVGLMFEERRIAWFFEGRVSEVGVVEFGSLDEPGAKILADRIEGRR